MDRGTPPRTASASARSPQARRASVPSPTDRRDHRRTAIARACLERFAAEGQADARLEHLAADAGLSRQNLLFYFRDKADLWAEAAAHATEELYRALTRLVAGEVGPAAIRASRRGIDEVSRVLPAAFAVALDAAATAVRASPAQQQRAAESQASFLSTLSASLAAPGRATDASLRVARLAAITLLAHHREARAHERSGLSPTLPLAADLDHAELQLVAIARTLGPRR
ncbi:MAG TPA: hypothetical protein VN033_10685 [Vulgatibacter sp.]|nr:hypothetical protein [Vulgatibacter sp.]